MAPQLLHASDGARTLPHTLTQSALSLLAHEQRSAYLKYRGAEGGAGAAAAAADF